MINKDDYELSSDGKTLIKWRNSSIEDLDMNMEEQLKNVIEIGSQAFVRSNLKTLVISKNTIKIN